MQNHLSICATKERITYSFDNSQIIDYQDNFKYMGDVPFSVYFDFETTTGDAVFFDWKMYVLSYCLIFTFNKSLNMDKIVTYRSFQQTSQQLYDLSHLGKNTFHFLIEQPLGNWKMLLLLYFLEQNTLP